jgi:subtilase family serine protease
MRKRTAIAASVLSVALTASIAVTVATSASATGNGRQTLAGSVPSWANAGSRISAAPTTDHVGFRVYLGWRNGGQAAALAAGVTTPGSANYRQFMTPAQFRQQFAPAQADVTAVQQWLHNQGFTVDYTPQNNHYVSAEGSVAQAEAAFGTTISLYTKDGLILHSPDGDLTVPDTLSSVVGVVGLDDSAALVQHAPEAPPSAAFVNGKPCSSYWGEKTTGNTATLDGTALPAGTPFAPCGYTPSQLESAYGVAQAVASGNDGSGQTVAIIDAYASPTIAQDANTYSAGHGLPQFAGSQFSQQVAPGTFNHPESGAGNKKKGPVQDPEGWYGEETLDVEAVHGIAPGADITFVSAPNNYQDLDAALNEVVDKHLASIVSNSYGNSTEDLPAGRIKPENDTFIQAALTGVGVYFSSGDNGDETGGDPANAASATPDWPASSPWVTSVGGTSLGVGSGGRYLFETGWQTGRSKLVGGAWSPAAPGTYLYGAGGGTSRLFPQPAYQAGVVPASMSQARGGAPMRVEPDVAALADPTTGMLVGQTQAFPDGTSRYSEYRIGGTSLACPLTAGFMALAQQKAGHDLGFANPLIYAHAGSAAFHDVTPSTGVSAVRAEYANSIDATNGYVYTLRSMSDDAGLTIHTAPGYDDVTGVGTPNGAAFLAALSQ